MKLFRKLFCKHQWRRYNTYDHIQREFYHCNNCGKWKNNDSPLNIKKYPSLSHWHSQLEEAHPEENRPL